MADREGLPDNFEDLDDFRKWLLLFKVNARKGFASLTTGGPGEPATHVVAEFWNRSDMAARLDIRPVIRNGRAVLDVKLTTAATPAELPPFVVGGLDQEG